MANPTPVPTTATASDSTTESSLLADVLEVADADGGATMKPPAHKSGPGHLQLCHSLKNAAEFNAGFGSCATYGPLDANHAWCGNDRDQVTHELAHDVCPECLKCIAAPAPKKLVFTGSTQPGAGNPAIAGLPPVAAPSSGPSSITVGVGNDSEEPEKLASTTAEAAIIEVSADAATPAVIDTYYKKDGVGSWGGQCTCPSGKTYNVGDISGTACASLACYGGIEHGCSAGGIPVSAAGMAVDCAPVAPVTAEGSAPSLALAVADTTTLVDASASTAPPTAQQSQSVSLEPTSSPQSVSASTTQEHLESPQGCHVLEDDLNGFDAGYGGCDTYGVAGPNHNFCATDRDLITDLLALDVCPECLVCTTTAPPDSPAMPVHLDQISPEPLATIHDANTGSPTTAPTQQFLLSSTSTAVGTAGPDGLAGHQTANEPNQPDGEIDGETTGSMSPPTTLSNSDAWAPLHAQCKHIDRAGGFDSGYGGCPSYATGEPNAAYCEQDADIETDDTASAVCPECGLCSIAAAPQQTHISGGGTGSQLVDNVAKPAAAASTSPAAPAETTVDASGTGSTTMEPAEGPGAGPSAVATAVGEVVLGQDDKLSTTADEQHPAGAHGDPCKSIDRDGGFDAGYGQCATYAAGEPNAPYCDQDTDLVTADVASAACVECGVCHHGE